MVLTYLSVALAYAPLTPAAVQNFPPLLLALPVLMVVGSLPSGLLSAFIIFIGMAQAWRMTAAPILQISGPYRVGSAQTPRNS